MYDHNILFPKRSMHRIRPSSSVIMILILILILRVWVRFSKFTIDIIRDHHRCTQSTFIGPNDRTIHFSLPSISSLDQSKANNATILPDEGTKKRKERNAHTVTYTTIPSQSHTTQKQNTHARRQREAKNNHHHQKHKKHKTWPRKDTFFCS